MKTVQKNYLIASLVLISLSILFYFLLTPSQAQLPNTAQRVQSGPFQLAIDVNGGLPQVGENVVTIKISDEFGEPQNQSLVRAYAQMAAMANMPSMRAPADLRKMGPGLYTGKMNLAMRGEWPLQITIDDPNMGATRLSFDMATGRQGLQLNAGGTVLSDKNMTAAPMSEAPRQEHTIEDDTYVSAGRYRVKFILPANKPINVGENPISALVTDTNGEPVADATLRMISQRVDNNETSSAADFMSDKPGEYHGVLILDAKVNHTIAIDIASPALGHADIILDAEIGKPQLHIATLTPQGISHYTCSMHSSVKSATPGSCPICGMNLVPVSKQQIQSGVITIDARRRQLIGLKTAKAEYIQATKSISVLGKINYNEQRLSTISLKFDAWIGELNANFVGGRVERGEPLFTVYSPELLSAQQEYLETLKRLSQRNTNDSLLAAARQRLMLWDISPAQIKALEQRQTPLKYLPIYAPSSGIVVARHVSAGSHIKKGLSLLDIADLSTVWVDAEVYEADLPLIHTGMSAHVKLPYSATQQYTAQIDYIYPYVNPHTRTTKVRLSLQNPSGELKPDMYATVSLYAELGQRLTVPEEAVLFAGESRIVFVDLGHDGQLKPVKVTTGQRGDGWIEITNGLQVGDVVVTSGNFLIAAEAKLKTGVEQW